MSSISKYIGIKKETRAMCFFSKLFYVLIQYYKCIFFLFVCYYPLANTRTPEFLGTKSQKDPLITRDKKNTWGSFIYEWEQKILA